MPLNDLRDGLGVESVARHYTHDVAVQGLLGKLEPPNGGDIPQQIAEADWINPFSLRRGYLIHCSAMYGTNQGGCSAASTGLIVQHHDVFHVVSKKGHCVVE